MLSLRPVRIHAILFFAILLGGVATLWAQSSDSLTGKWKMVSITPDGSDIPWTLSIAENGGKYSATVSGEEGETPAKDFRVEGNKIHFRTPYEGADYDIDLTREGNKLDGKWSGNGDSGQTKGERAGS